MAHEAPGPDNARILGGSNCGCNFSLRQINSNAIFYTMNPVIFEPYHWRKKYMVKGILQIFMITRVLFSNERVSSYWESFLILLIDIFTHLLINLSGKLLQVKIKWEHNLKYYFCIILSHVLECIFSHISVNH